MISLIVAMDKRGLIGNKNALPWHYPADLKYFKKTTLNKTVLMGRKTFESILSLVGKPLPQRHSIVLTRDKEFSYPGVEVVHSFDEVLKRNFEEEIFIIGGKQVYEASLAYVQRMYITHINKEYLGDTYLEGIDYSAFKKIYQENVDDLSFCIYERR